MSKRYYVEALLKTESPDPDFQTCYEYIILEIVAEDEDFARLEAERYMQKYNREYQGGVWIKNSFIRIISIHEDLDFVSGRVREIMAVPFADIEAFDKWKNTDWITD